MEKIKYIISILIGGLIGFFLCIFLQKNNSNNAISKQQIFDNNIKCQKYLEEYRNELKDKGYTDIFVFYSPIENSCLGTFQSYNLYNNNIRFNGYTYTIEKLSDLNKYIYFSAKNYYSGDNLISIRHITDNFGNKECSDIDYRNYTEEDIEYYNSIKRCNFDDIKEEFEKELEYLKSN